MVSTVMGEVEFMHAKKRLVTCTEESAGFMVWTVRKK
jgi:hypothetical protein